MINVCIVVLSTTGTIVVQDATTVVDATLFYNMLQPTMASFSTRNKMSFLFSYIVKLRRVRYRYLHVIVYVFPGS